MTALSVGVGTMLAVTHAAAQSAEPASVPPVVNPQPSPGLPLTLPVPPIGGVGRSRKHLARPEDFRPVFVSLHIPGRSFEVLGDADALVATCSDTCQFWAYAGNYHVRLANVPGEESKIYRLRVGKPGDYMLVFGDDGERDAGLALGITGSAAFVVGMVVLVTGLLSESDCGIEHNECPVPSSVYYGLATMGAGATMGAVGFVLFGGNITHFRYDGAPLPVITRVGAVPVPGGVGLGTTISF